MQESALHCGVMCVKLKYICLCNSKNCPRPSNQRFLLCVRETANSGALTQRRYGGSTLENRAANAHTAGERARIAEVAVARSTASRGAKAGCRRRRRKSFSGDGGKLITVRTWGFFLHNFGGTVTMMGTHINTLSLALYLITPELLALVQPTMSYIKYECTSTFFKGALCFNVDKDTLTAQFLKSFHSHSW